MILRQTNAEIQNIQNMQNIQNVKYETSPKSEMPMSQALNSSGSLEESVDFVVLVLVI